MPDNDPGVLARKLRDIVLYRKGLAEGDRRFLHSVATYLESLSAPVEDEEKVRDYAANLLVADRLSPMVSAFVEGAKYARRAPVLTGEVMDPNFGPTKADLEALRRDYAATECEGLPVTVHLAPKVLYINWTNGQHDPKVPGSQPGRCIAFRIEECPARAPVGVTVGEPLADARLKVIPVLQRLAILSIYDRETETSCIATNLEDELRAVVAMLQANGVSGSPPSPKQTSELEALGCGGLK